jgi:DNA uptake protein ComE-like DNA-binding protein
MHVEEAISDEKPFAKIDIKSLTAFDPNKVDSQQLVAFGLNPRAAANWMKYLKAGGSFSSAEDIGKLYGMCDEWLAAVIPYVDIPPNESDRFDDNKKAKQPVFIDLNRRDSADLCSFAGWSPEMVDSVLLWQQEKWFPQRYQERRLLEWNLDSLMLIRGTMAPKYSNFHANKTIEIRINEADTAEWAALRGIGPVLSRRIVNYRKALGGFISVEQVAEVYGISPVLFGDIKTQLVLDSVKIETIDLNRTSLRRLRNHPYIDFYMAKAILDERRMNGPIVSLDQIAELEVFEEELWNKLKNYLLVEVSEE